MEDFNFPHILDSERQAGSLEGCGVGEPGFYQSSFTQDQAPDLGETFLSKMSTPNQESIHVANAVGFALDSQSINLFSQVTQAESVANTSRERQVFHSQPRTAPLESPQQIPSSSYFADDFDIDHFLADG